MPRRNDEFYVGYLDRSPPSIASHTRAAVAVVLALGIAVTLFLVSFQSRFDAGTFEFGVDRSFEGIVVERPYPMLLVPSGDDSGSGLVTHYLVGFGKHGADKLVTDMDSTPARIAGSLIHNTSQRMIEVHAVERLMGADAEALQQLQVGIEQRIGTLTLAGEIVDSKCHLGVMKPGRGKTHKACAIRCISGGIPPLLRVEDRTGRVEYFLLASADGQPVNRAVLGMIAEPVEITGEVARANDLLILYADPSTYHRVGS